MARTVIHSTTLTANAATANPAGTTIDQPNGMYIAAGNATEELFLRVSHTAASTKTATVNAGDSPPGNIGGALTITSTGDGSTTPVVSLVGPFTSARFLQSDGTVEIDFASSSTGTVEVIRIPRTA